MHSTSSELISSPQKSLSGILGLLERTNQQLTRNLPPSEVGKLHPLLNHQPFCVVGVLSCCGCFDTKTESTGRPQISLLFSASYANMHFIASSQCANRTEEGWHCLGDLRGSRSSGCSKPTPFARSPPAQSAADTRSLWGFHAVLVKYQPRQLRTQGLCTSLLA